MARTYITGYKDQNGIDLGSKYVTKEYVREINSNLFPSLKNPRAYIVWGGNTYGSLGLGNTTNQSSPLVFSSSANWSQLSYAMGIKPNGTLWSWGQNGNGQGGLGDTVLRSSPVQVGVLTDWATANSRYPHTMAVKTDGTLWAWGINPYGQLGLGNTTWRSSPVQVGSLTTWSQAQFGIGGSYHISVVKSDGALWSWGSNFYGELGTYDLAPAPLPKSSPVQVGSLTDWTSIGAGGDFTLAVKSNGTLWGWGNNLYGQLGLGDTVPKSSPVQIGSLTNWSSVAVGKIANLGSSIAVKTDGTLWAWGKNTTGQLGLGDIASRSSPVQVGALSDWSRVSSSGHTTAVKTDGTLWTWGYNGYGELGTYDLITLAQDVSSPVQVGSLTTWAKVCMVSGVLAIKTDGTLWSWGQNGNGQLGHGDTVLRSSPVQVGALTDWSQITGTAGRTYAIKTDGTLWACGYNGDNILGFGNSVSYSSPVQLGSALWSTFDAGSDCTGAIKTDGTLWTWGYNNFGQLGLGNTTTRSTPVQVGVLTTWSKIAVGSIHMVAIKTDGTIWSWGNNAYGQLGHSGTTTVYTPTQIGLLTNWAKVFSSYRTNLAIKTDGTLWGWGAGLNGQVGNGSANNFTSPVQIGLDTNWVEAHPGDNSSIGIKSNGTLWAWGLNSSGSLGLGGVSTLSTSSPVQIGTLTDWATPGSVSSSNSVGVVKTDGTLWLWGENTSQQLGIYTQNVPSLVNKSSPIQIGSLTNWSQISNGDSFTTAIKTDGTLWVWGKNDLFQLGLGGVVNHSSPVQIGSLTTWSKVDAGTNFATAIKTDGTIWSWGSNAYGQLGQGSTTNQANPTQIVEAGGSSVASATATSITYAEGGTSGLTSYVYPTNWSSQDDAFIGFNLPFNIQFCGVTYSTVYVGTNSYLTFGGGSSNYSSLSASNPALPKIAVSAADNSAQRMYAGVIGSAPNRSFRIRFEGNNSTSGTLGSPTMVWEATFYENTPSVIDLQIVLNSKGNTGLKGVFTASTQLLDLVVTAGQAYSITTSLTTTPPPSGTPWAQVANGSTHTLATKTDGTLRAWGRNSDGQLGLGDLTNRSSPVQIGALTTWSKITAGSNHSLAINTSGAVYSWGGNSSGQLGYFDLDVPSLNNKSSPVQVGLLTNWKLVSSSDSNNIAIKTDGTIWAWGRNANYELGLGDLIPRSSPTQIGSLTTWKQVETSANSVIAIKTDGTLWAWGQNTQGQLGLGDRSTRSIPTQVGTLTNWSKVSQRGGLTVIALKTDGTLWSWGYNGTGDLGQANSTSRSSPVQVGSLNTWVDIQYNSALLE